ncbi:hypothetical protein J2W40_001690 [Sphingobium xenophagum]|uniref:Deacetylase PdaC domain-containing protein n=1 Tax=Sphingobium xenophagum TaxID=121428 RepID=A0ABU1WZW3_SPHXE|nr:DUF4163 domain-containing protein [Sphingobium xenophagum]MDR7154872.1 hypothetical protein [Sphingobium xenophagum]
MRRAHAPSGLIAVLLVAACAPSSDAPVGNAAENEAAARYADRMAGTPPPAPPSKPFAVKETAGGLEFAYAYPAEAAAVPALVDKFARDMAATKADALKMAKEDSAAAKGSGYPFRPHSLETQWSVAADTPRFLALQSQTYVYTGGAHGMTGYDAVLWDKARKQESSVKALMTSPAAFSTAIRDRFCAILDQQRAEKRGAPVVRGDDDFTQCIDPMEQVLVPTSKDGKLIDGLTVVVGPYSAGPYAEGSYEVGLSVDAAMRNAIKPDYRDAFVAVK